MKPIINASAIINVPCLPTLESLNALIMAIIVKQPMTLENTRNAKSPVRYERFRLNITINK